MNNTWNDIAECLRQEVSEYGALYQYYEDQQRRLFAQDAEAVLRLSGDIEAQARTLHECRRKREDVVTRFAKVNGQSPAATIRSLLPFVPQQAQPLIEALISEINVLIHRVRRMSRHNHAMLSRTVELQQQMLRQFLPDTFSQTYAPDGRVALHISSPLPSLRTCG